MPALRRTLTGNRSDSKSCRVRSDCGSRGKNTKSVPGTARSCPQTRRTRGQRRRSEHRGARPAAAGTAFEQLLEEVFELTDEGKIGQQGPIDQEAVAACMERWKDEYRLVAPSEHDLTGRVQPSDD